MRAYLPLVLEILIAVVVIGWGVRELILLKRDEAEEPDDDAPAPSDRSSRD